MQQKFSKLFRWTGAVIFGVVLAASSLALTAPELLAQRPARVQRAQPAQGAPVKKIDPNTKELPFSGLATQSAEDQAQALEGKSFDELWQAATKLTEEGMIADAKAIYKHMLGGDYSDSEYLKALTQYVSVTTSFSIEDEVKFADVEQALEEALAARANSWRVKTGVAGLLDYLPNAGYMRDGKFVYTYGWRQDMLSCQERKRVRKLQIYADALPLARKDIARINAGDDEKDDAWLTLAEASNYYLTFARALHGGGAYDYWRQQTLTDLSVLPDYLPATNVYRENRSSGAPVDEAGAPVFFTAPESFEAAKNDGERRQALLDELIEKFPAYKADVCSMRAQEAQEVFGVQTLASYRFFFNEDSGADQESRQEGIWALNTLADNETIAKLATGVKRFELPPEYDYINLWREIIEIRGLSDWSVLVNLAQEYQNRRQLDKAAEVWKQILDQKNIPDYVLEQAKSSLSQIVDPRVSIDASSVVAGTKTDLNIRFRNAVGAEIVAKRLNVDEPLKIVRSDKFWQDYGGYGNLNSVIDLILRQQFLPKDDKSNEQLDSKQRKLFESFQKIDFIGEEVARYSVEFEPDPNHYDKIKRVDFPISEPGAYLVEITATDGNKDVAIVWLRDVAIVRKPFENGRRYFALDAESGEPIVEQQIEFFVVNRRWNNGRYSIKTKGYTKRTDKAGSVLFANDEIKEQHSTEVLAVVPKDGRDKKSAAQYSFMDFQGIWRVYASDDFFQNTRAFFVSDRPIYRPNQKAEFKFIVGDARYDAPDDSKWAGQELDYQILSPSGEKVAKKRVTLDEYGAFSDSFEIPGDAKLGVYSVQLARHFHDNGTVDTWLGNGSFRLEEYRKPEFQVTVDAPKEPVALGDAFKAKVNAKYYFGAPVANAVVSYKVIRTNHRSTYFPARYWDWFYGCGYWQFTYDYDWYPGWRHWGCMRLPLFYMPQSTGVPEVVSEGEAKIGEDGNFEITVDTSLAKLIYPNDDQQYEITAEVTDQSRRTIVGSGKVYAARRPFQTYVWFDQGYFRVGDTMNLGIHARRLDGKGVSGAAVVKLYKVEYAKTDDGSVKPIETEVYADELRTDEEGKGSAKFVAAESGQYRVSCVVTSDNGIAQEGGQLVVVRGVTEVADAKADYRFNALEIIPDKPEYSVGDVAHIQIASNNPNGYVLFTARPRGEVTMGEPQFVKLENGLAYVDVPIEVADQPNIFVQATTVFGGKIYSEQKELAVPPEKRVLDVAVEPSAERVKPGEKAAVKLRLTDVDGNPVVGQTVVTIYDKSLEYISGGSNVGDVREFFWKWRRYANLSSVDNLSQATLRNVFALIYQTRHMDRLQPIGVFGNEIFHGATDESGMVFANGLVGGVAGGGARMRRSSGLMAAMPTEVDMLVLAESAASAEMIDAAPAPAAAPLSSVNAPMEKKEIANDLEFAEEGSSAEESAPLVEATVRKNLADLAYWAADLTPGDDGVIEIEVDMPENLTTWKIAAWSVGAGLRVGSGEAEIVTSKDVIIRMQKPRFLTQKDEVVFSANVHNYLDSEKNVQVSLEFPTDDPENSTATLTFMDGVEQTQNVVVPANGEARVDWSVRADGPGVATLVMKALTNEESDAIQETITVKEHGVSKQIAVSGVVPPAEKDENATEAKEDDVNIRESTFTLTIPEERRHETTKLTVGSHRPSPALFSTRCPTSSTTRTAAPSRRLTGSCRPS
jgi:hypothetical protein